MKLKELIIEVLNKGAKLKSREIINRITLLDPINIYTVTDINKSIYHELKNKVIFDKLTYKYYLKDKVKNIEEFTNLELIKKTLEITDKSMSLIDISNYIRTKYNKNLKIDDIQIILLVDLKDSIGIDNSNLSVIKFFLN
jgi:hypothetical protein